MSGVVSSIITNSAAMVGVETLNSINTSLNNVQNQISTGYSVSSAVDNGAAFAVAQSVRTNMAGLTAANQQLGDTQGLLATTNTALTNISNLMQSMDATLVNLSSSTISTSQKSQYVAQFSSQLQNLQYYIKGASYNGKALIGASSGTLASSSSSFTSKALQVSSDASGGQIKIAAQSMTTVYLALSKIGTSLGTASAGSTTITNWMTAGGTFSTQVSNVGSYLNTYGNLTNQVDAQITYNQNKMDALSNGLGALVDANMAAESAKLQSLQIQQQLATSALSIANQQPSILTKLI
ncbi:MULTISPECIES: flagellin [Acidiphilium]|jgi:flagellin|uniref:Flagellin n=2 Tax=Acidiphilium TaxID=522 RepID=A5FUQ4_ACICJ|nr:MULTISPECIES: flagellin [Acidiphilium]ABQ29336.1 flagellin domain protein [Acidiphilium cryptum JF-5]KDM67252.1 flagellin [Acidiphilium sp. JA12-A1]MBS3025635.1 flagellin [Acidiphilium multivorum]UNC13394.1 flagellin [Acidiphilium multivorum]BAJ79480.1 flagellin [Acidiphilium multivorum AIU301]